MNDGAYDEGVQWSTHKNAKAEPSAYSSDCVDYVASTPLTMGDRYWTNHSDLHVSHRPDHRQPSGQQRQFSYHQYGDSYHSPSSHYGGVMDSQTMLEDFEAFTRERCHTWPGVQPRPPAAMGGQQEGTDEDNNKQLHCSPPPLPSRGSSGLSLISESNESFLATPTSAGATPDSCDWTSTNAGVDVGYVPREYGSQANVIIQTRAQQSPASTTASASPLPVMTNSNKRSLTATPSYKSGHPSYVELITQAILSSAEKRMTLSEIYDWMVANVPSFKDQRHLHSSAGWKNSVRHNLSLHARFKRVKRNGMDKPSWWTVDLSEEAKRERSKRPRQTRPRANTTTATSREIQTQRQQQRQIPAQRQHRPSLGFAQPQLPHHSDHASSGHGSMSFSGSMTPASSIGSDIFVTGTAGASNVPIDSGQFGVSQHSSGLLQESLMPPPQLMAPYQFLTAPLDGSIAEDGMEWTHYSNNAAAPSVPPVRANDQLLDAVPNVAESTNLHCLSQAITVSLRDPTTTAPECAKTDVALTLTAPHGFTSDSESAATNYFGAMNPGNVSNLVHAFQQNRLDEANNHSSSGTLRQLLRVHDRTSVGHAQEVSVPSPIPIRVVLLMDMDCQTEPMQQTEAGCAGTSFASSLQMNSPARSSSHSPLASCVLQQQQQQQQLHQGLNVANSPQQQLSPAASLQSQQHPSSLSPAQYQYFPTSYVQNGGTRKVPGATGQLPDDLAALDVGGLDCNIMDVLSYEMNCNSSNATGFA